MRTRAYRDPMVEQDKEKRRAAVAERFKRRVQPENLSCPVCGAGGLHKVRLSNCTFRFCDKHFQDFSRLASFLVEDMSNEGIQHTDQGEFPKRLADGLRLSKEQPVPVPVQVHEADGTGPATANTSGESV